MGPAEKRPVTAAEFELLDEHGAECVLWRLHQLLDAGFDPDGALELATHLEVDLHKAIELARRGCPHRTALRILL